MLKTGSSSYFGTRKVRQYGLLLGYYRLASLYRQHQEKTDLGQTPLLQYLSLLSTAYQQAEMRGGGKKPGNQHARSGKGRGKDHGKQDRLRKKHTSKQGAKKKRK